MASGGAWEDLPLAVPLRHLCPWFCWTASALAPWKDSGWLRQGRNCRKRGQARIKGSFRHTSNVVLGLEGENVRGGLSIRGLEGGRGGEEERGRRRTRRRRGAPISTMNQDAHAAMRGDYR